MKSSRGVGEGGVIGRSSEDILNVLYTRSIGRHLNTIFLLIGKINKMNVKLNKINVTMKKYK